MMPESGRNGAPFLPVLLQYAAHYRQDDRYAEGQDNADDQSDEADLTAGSPGYGNQHGVHAAGAA